jgi:hypothetical protein
LRFLIFDFSHIPIEKIVIKRPLESLRGRENPCLKSTPQERLAAMAVICQTHDDGKPESRLSRLHYAIGKKVC